MPALMQRKPVFLTKIGPKLGTGSRGHALTINADHSVGVGHLILIAVWEKLPDSVSSFSFIEIMV